jgi:hypothetical protein
MYDQLVISHTTFIIFCFPVLGVQQWGNSLFPLRGMHGVSVGVAETLHMSTTFVLLFADCTYIIHKNKSVVIDGDMHNYAHMHYVTYT